MTSPNFDPSVSYTFSDIAEMAAPELSALCSAYSIERLPPDTDPDVDSAYLRRQLLLRLLADYFAVTCYNSVSEFQNAAPDAVRLVPPEQLDVHLNHHFRSYPQSNLTYSTLAVQLPTKLFARSDPVFDQYLTRIRNNNVGETQVGLPYEPNRPRYTTPHTQSRHQPRQPPIPAHYGLNSDDEDLAGDDPPYERPTAYSRSHNADNDARFTTMEAQLRNATTQLRDATSQIRDLTTDNQSLRAAHRALLSHPLAPVPQSAAAFSAMETGRGDVHPGMRRLSVISSRLRNHQPILPSASDYHPQISFCQPPPPVLDADRRTHRFYDPPFGTGPQYADPSPTPGHWKVKNAKYPNLPAFDGSPKQSFQDWFTSFLTRYGDVPPAEQLVLLSGHLHGRASRTWVSLSDNVRNNYDLAIAALLQTYDPPIGRHEADRQFRTAKLGADETVTQYLERLRELLLRLDPTMPPDTRDDQLRLQFPRGLPEQIQEQLNNRFAGYSPTLFEMTTAAADLITFTVTPIAATASSLPQSQALRVRADAVSDIRAFMTAWLDADNADLATTPSTVAASTAASVHHVSTPSSHYRVDNTTTTWHPPQRPPTYNHRNDCRNCFQPGHWAAKCTMPCRYCGHKNHTSFSCKNYPQTPPLSRSSSIESIAAASAAAVNTVAARSGPGRFPPSGLKN